MSCNECRDDRNTRAIRDIAVAVLLICWAVWMLIDDVQSLKNDVVTLKRRLTNTNDSLYLVHERVHEMTRDAEPGIKTEGMSEEEVDLNG